MTCPNEAALLILCHALDNNERKHAWTRLQINLMALNDYVLDIYGK